MLESYWNPHFSVPPESLSPSYTTGPSGSCPKSTTKSGFHVRPPFLGWSEEAHFQTRFQWENKFYKHWCLQSNPCSSRWDVLHWINISQGMHIKNEISNPCVFLMFSIGNQESLYRHPTGSAALHACTCQGRTVCPKMRRARWRHRVVSHLRKAAPFVLHLTRLSSIRPIQLP